MTREDALNKTIGILTYHQVNFCKSKEAVANMNEIIEALEKIDQEPCGDVVSRQAVLEAIEDDNRNEHYSCFATNNDAECFKQIIRELPSVTSQPKIGHWEWNQYDANPKIGNFHCSLCHSIGRTYFDYCPYCGAKMSEIPTGAEGSDKE